MKTKHGYASVFVYVRVHEFCLFCIKDKPIYSKEAGAS